MNMANPVDIYTEHFGLTERPFSLVPDPDFLFWSAAHKRAFTMLEYGLFTRAPITLVTGEVGAGKTTLVQYLLKQMTDDLTIGLISNAQGGRGELLRWVMTALSQSISKDADYVDLFSQFQQFLIDEYSQGRRVVLIFDEAQNLGRETLEELRMFTNINANKDELLQLIIVGQPELRELVSQPGLQQFCQRVSANVHLSAMNAETVREYIKYRMQKAGATQDVFTEEAIGIIAQSARGIPRVVNQLADISLVYAFSEDQNMVSADVVRSVLKDDLLLSNVLYLEKSEQ
jgi:type II secretory pathway predicted ATPase ExeA